MGNYIKIANEISRVDGLIQQHYTNLAFGKPIDESQLNCWREYLVLLDYLKFKSIESYELSRFIGDCPVECDLTVELIGCDLGIVVNPVTCQLVITVIQ